MPAEQQQHGSADHIRMQGYIWIGAAGQRDGLLEHHLVRRIQDLYDDVSEAKVVAESRGPVLTVAVNKDGGDQVVARMRPLEARGDAARFRAGREPRSSCVAIDGERRREAGSGGGSLDRALAGDVALGPGGQE